MNRTTPITANLACSTVTAAPPVTTVTPQVSAHAPLRADVFVGGQRVEIHARSAQELWRQTCQFEEFPSRCGLCNSVDLTPGYRRIREFEFYSIQCRTCGSTLPLGQRKDGGLFPKLRVGWQPARHPSDTGSS
jgi:hypothetical protein